MMGSIKDEANSYEPPKTMNIADLDFVDVTTPIEDREGTKEDGSVFKYKAIIKDEKEYRVPNVVLGNLKDLLKVSPNLTKFKVVKSGEGLKTRYTIVPIL